MYYLPPTQVLEAKSKADILFCYTIKPDRIRSINLLLILIRIESLEYYLLQKLFLVEVIFFLYKFTVYQYTDEHTRKDQGAKKTAKSLFEAFKQNGQKQKK